MRSERGALDRCRSRHGEEIIKHSAANFPVVKNIALRIEQRLDSILKSRWKAASCCSMSFRRRMNERVWLLQRTCRSSSGRRCWAMSDWRERSWIAWRIVATFWRRVARVTDCGRQGKNRSKQRKIGKWAATCREKEKWLYYYRSHCTIGVLRAALFKCHPHLTQLQAKDIVQHVLDSISETLVEEGRIELRNFGVFVVRKRKHRKARNPRTGEAVKVKEKSVVVFKFGKALNETLRKKNRKTPGKKTDGLVS